MRGIELLIVAWSLSLDAFAAAVCKGMAEKRLGLRGAGVIGAWFGAFQALMPLIGYGLGKCFCGVIDRYAPLGALLLLSFLGVHMLLEDPKEEKAEAGLTAARLFPLALGTSMDALTAGVTFAALPTDILFAALVTGVCTFLMSAFGALLGHRITAGCRRLACALGGCLLIGMGIRGVLLQMEIL